MKLNKNIIVNIWNSIDIFWAVNHYFFNRTENNIDWYRRLNVVDWFYIEVGFKILIPYL